MGEWGIRSIAWTEAPEVSTQFLGSLIGDTESPEVRDPGQGEEGPLGTQEGGTVVSRGTDDIMSAWPADASSARAALPSSGALSLVPGLA